MQLQITVTGDKETAAKLKRLGNKLSDFTNPMREIGKQSAKYYSTVGFLSQGGVYGKPWERLSADYALRKSLGNKLPPNVGKGGFPGKPPLVATGTMQDSFTYDYNSKQVSIGNKAPYYKYHQSSRLPRKKLPRRQMAGINGPIRSTIVSIIRKDIEQKIASA